MAVPSAPAAALAATSAATEDPATEATIAATIAAIASAQAEEAETDATSDADFDCSSNWALTAIGATTTPTTSTSSSSSAVATSSILPTSTDRVLICLISSGVHKDSPALSHNRWTGCTKEDSLDPTGCALPWATQPSAAGFKPRGTWAASIMASAGGVIPGAADIHVVPVDGPGSGSVEPDSAVSSGKSRLRAYSVCEGRLRGLQAAEYGSSTAETKAPWRMVMLVDVAAAKPANSGTDEYALSEADWVRVATGSGTPEAAHAPDVLIVAPSGNNAAVGYPAALPGVLAVGGFKCSGEPLTEHTDTARRLHKPDMLAPGGNIAVPGTDKVWEDDSAAAAFVAGAAARLWSAYPRCSADDIKAALRSSASSDTQAAVLSLPAAEAALQLSSCATPSNTDATV